MQPPTGYSMKADAWVNSSALLGRMNFAMALTSGKLKGVQVDNELAPIRSENPQQTLIALENILLAGDVSKQTHDVITTRLQDVKISRRKLDDPARSPNISMIEGLLLGSPEFQRR
jgi:signal recognition particle GTPase